MRATANRLIPITVLCVTGACSEPGPEGLLAVALLTATEYEVVDLGTFGMEYAMSTGINDAGHITVLAHSGRGSERVTRSFIWRSSADVVEVQPPRGALEVQIHGLNNAGVASGFIITEEGHTRAILWHETTGIVNLGTLGGNGSVGVTVNGRGQVVGRSDTADGEGRAFRWEAAKGMESLGTVQGGNSSYALGINDRGDVVGEANDAFGVSHAFLWTGHMMRITTATEDISRSQAFAIDNRRRVAGTQWDMNGRARAFMWTESDGTVLMQEREGWTGTYGWYIGGPTGWVVGEATLGIGAVDAVVWRGGQPTVLESLGGTYSQTWAINAKGDIAGLSTSTAGNALEHGRAVVWRHRGQ
jgi:probable HAF family extracellular repeat protein